MSVAVTAETRVRSRTAQYLTPPQPRRSLLAVTPLAISLPRATHALRAFVGTRRRTEFPDR
ncbi:hypothetical protein ABNG03_15160 [Halorubrum sp. RMP-47]|uniref:hypothetical protein n=1 Tax=Halorubrum miltondacostae TaxID=3076378 RepID=UPI0035273AF6